MRVLMGCLCPSASRCFPGAMPNFRFPDPRQGFWVLKRDGMIFCWRCSLGAMPVICFTAGLWVPFNTLGPLHRGGSLSPGCSS